MSKEIVELNFVEKAHDQLLEVVLPKGISLKELGKINLGDLVSKFRPKGCETCLSGMDLRIRERFGSVLRVKIDNGALVDTL